MFRSVAGGVVALALGVAIPLVGAQPPAAEVRYTPDALLALAAADLPASPHGAYTRYISLDDLPDEKSRAVWEKVIAGHLQTLSSEPGLAVPVRAGVLLRINTKDYGDTFAAQWERLGKVEPFWHGDDVVVEDQYEEVPYGYYYDGDGRPYSEGGPGRKFKAHETRREKVTKAGRSVRRFFVRGKAGRDAMEAFAKYTGGTDVPVVRATWFLGQTAVSWQRDPGYYEFTGIKDLKTYEQVIGFVRKGQSPGFLRDLRAATGHSGVTTPDTLRRIVRFQAPAGGYWFTQDSDQRIHQKDEELRRKANPLAELGDDYVFDAVEAIGYGPNGFPKTGLFDSKGVRQDRAPDNIAGDDTGVFHDHRIHINLSCLRCHTDGYLQDVDDWVRKDLDVVGLLGTKLGYEKSQEVRSQYVTQYLEPNLAKDRASYAAALWQVTRMKPDGYAAAYAGAFHDAAENPVTLDAAARQLGVASGEAREAFLKAGAGFDIALVPLRNKSPRALAPVVWQGSFQRAADAVHGVARPYKVTVKEGER